MNDAEDAEAPQSCVRARACVFVRGPRVCLELKIFLWFSVRMQREIKKGGNDVVDVWSSFKRFVGLVLC